jgi:hypothetical protein
MTRDRIWVSIATGAAVLTLALGFLHSGSPAQMRRYEADSRRAADLGQIGQAIHQLWQSQSAGENQLPEKLSELAALPSAAPLRLLDPQTMRPYEYRALGGSRYELCAEFAEVSAPPRAGEIRFWSHPPGRACFTLDAKLRPPPQ